MKIQKTALLVVLSIVIFSNAHCQQTFAKVIIDSSSSFDGAMASCTVSEDINGIFIGGSVAGEGSFMKVDSIGNLEWAKTITIPDTANNFVVFNNVISTSDSNVLYLGTVRSIGAMQGPIITMKVNSQGDTLWTTILKSTNFSTSQTCGVESFDSSYFILWNNYMGSNEFGLARLSQTGSVMWSKVLDCANPLNFYSIDMLSDSTLLLSGSKELVNVDLDGTILWTKRYPTLHFDDVAIIENGFLATTRRHIGANFFRAIHRFSNDGTAEWSYRHSSLGHTGAVSDYNSLLLPWSDSSYLFSFRTNSNASPTLSYLIDTNGTVISDFVQFGISGGGAIKTKDGGGIFIGNGPSEGIKSATYDPHIGLIKVDSVLQSDNCTSTVSSSMQSDSLINGTPFVIDSLSVPQIIYLPLSLNIPPLIQEDGCVSFISNVETLNDVFDIHIYPNLSSGVFNIQTNNFDKKHVLVVDSYGRTVYQKYEHDMTFKLDLSREDSGIYFLSIQGLNGIAKTSKLLLNK